MAAVQSPAVLPQDTGSGSAHTHEPAVQPRPFLEELPVRQPMFWAGLAFAAGIWIGHSTWRPLTWWLVASVAFAGAATYFLNRRPWFSRVLAVVACIFSGAFAVQAPSSDSGVLWLGDEQEVTVTAHVIEEGNLEEEAPGAWRQRIAIETEQITSGTRSENVRAGVRLSIYSQSSGRYDLGIDTEIDERGTQKYASEMPGTRLFHYGERIRFDARLRQPRNYGNPGAFDYVDYLREQGVVATASAKLANIEILPGRIGGWFRRGLAVAHRSILQKIHLLWEEADAALIDAMLIGEKSFIERPVRVNFQRSGTYHMLIVSGLHVGILAGFILWVLRRLGLGEGIASLCSVAAIFAYAELTNQGTPVWRAALMFAAYLATRLLYRKRALLNALGAAALLLLIANPQALFGASFQMSFLCVGLIAGVGLPLLERTSGPYAQGLRDLDSLPFDRSLAPKIAQFRIDLRMILERIPSIIPGRASQHLLVTTLRYAIGAVDLIILSAVMQFGMALPMAMYFHRATSVGIPANVLAVPLLQVLMPAALVAVGATYVWTWATRLPTAIAHLAISGIAGTVQQVGGWRIADVRLATPDTPVVLFAGCAIFSALLLVRRRAWFAAGGLVLLVASTLSIWGIAPQQKIHPGVLEMTAIDVGQGDAILLVTPDGHKVLMDAGGLPFWMHSQMDIGEDVVSPYLWGRGISRLDAIAVTHAHADHMAGFLSIIPNFRPRELWLPQTIPLDEIGSVTKIAELYGVRLSFYKAGDSFSYGGADVRVLAPDPNYPVRSGKRNDESLIVKIGYGATSALLEGDAEKGTEKLISREQPQADVLKVAHHGSATATNDDFLLAARPRFAVISVGRRNVYRHPRREVLQRLQEHKVLTYRTDRHGATSFLLDGKTVTVQLPDRP